MNSRLTRRQFVKSVAAATALPTIVRATAWGADDRAAPSERIAVALIGCGKMANDYHLPSLLKMNDVQLVAVCEVDRTRREHAKGRVDKQYGVEAAQGCVFTGTKGKLHIGRGVLTSEPESIVKEPLRDDEVHLFRSPGHHRNWLECIKSREKCVAPVEAGARTVTVVHLGNLAYWHHRRSKWDPQNWRFLDDEEANQKFLDNPRRAPWQLPAA